MQAYGVTRIYSPEDGQRMGLRGMIDDMVQRSDFARDKTAVPSSWEASS